MHLYIKVKVTPLSHKFKLVNAVVTFLLAFLIAAGSRSRSTELARPGPRLGQSGQSGPVRSPPPPGVWHWSGEDEVRLYRVM